MEITSYTRRSSFKLLVVENVPAFAPEDEVLQFAMAHAGENKSSLFGWHVERDGTRAVVQLNTD